MSIELALNGATLIGLVGMFLRTESRITRLETLMQLIIDERGKK